MRHADGLDDRDYAAFAWARYRKILRYMALCALAVALAVVAILWWSSGPLPWIFVGLTIGGVWATIMMAASLMGLMFLSNGSGHDSTVADPLAGEVDIGDD